MQLESARSISYLTFYPLKYEYVYIIVDVNKSARHSRVIVVTELVAREPSDSVTDIHSMADLHSKILDTHAILAIIFVCTCRVKKMKHSLALLWTETQSMTTNLLTSC